MKEMPTPGQADSSETNTIPPGANKRRGLWRLAIFIGVALALFIAGLFLPVREWFIVFRDWVEQQGVWGAVCFGLVYVVCTVLFVPGSILTLGAGAIYGPVWGTLLISLASTTGAACAFLVGRYLARDQVQAWVQSN